MRVFIILLLFSSKLFSQENDNKLNRNVIFVELFGNTGTLLSLNYEYIFHQKNNSNYAAKIGYAISENRFDDSRIHKVPFELKGIFGRKKNYLEVGIGFIPLFGTSNLKSPEIPDEYKVNFDYYYTFNLGYRFYDIDDPIVIRFTPGMILRRLNPKSNKYRVRLIFMGSTIFKQKVLMF